MTNKCGAYNYFSWINCISLKLEELQGNLSIRNKKTRDVIHFDTV